MHQKLVEMMASLVTRREIHIAADWWADQLFQQALPDAGDPTRQIEASILAAQSNLDQPTERQINVFRNSLVALTAVLCADSWREEDPHWGSANRTLATDYGPDSTLQCALNYSGISGGSLWLPIKTIVWISPLSVRVQPGYHGQEVELFSGDVDSS